MKFGNLDITLLNFGSQRISKVLFGTEEVFPGGGIPAGFGRIFLKTVAGAPGFEIRCTGDFTVADSLGSTDYTGSTSYQQITVQPQEFVQIDFRAASGDSIRFAAATTAWRVYVEEINVISFGDIAVGLEMFRNCRAMVYLKLPAISPAWNNCQAMFQNCYVLECIFGQIDSRSATTKANMFSNSTAIITPDATDRADLADADGALWTNNTPCY